MNLSISSYQHIGDRPHGARSEDSGTMVLLDDGSILLAVADGAGPLETYPGNPKGFSPGYFASSTVILALRDHASPDISLVDLALKANRSLGEATARAGIVNPTKLQLPTTTLAVVRIYPDGHFEWVQVGDSLIVTVKKESCKILGGFQDHDGPTFKKWWEALDHNPDLQPGQCPEMDADEMRVGCLVNNFSDPKGYPVLTGESELERFLKERTGYHGTGTLYDIGHIFVMTDGFYLPTKRYEEFPDLYLTINHTRQDGLDHAAWIIRETLLKDPLSRKYPRFGAKGYDDQLAFYVKVY